ncbi:polysaccharide biosynthesis protein [bacterium]|nr:polysaccharide biosynthesis protein [bacterium]
MLKDFVKYVPSFLIPAIAGLLSVSLFTRLISVENYGKYILVLTTVTFIGNIGFGWLNYSCFRFFDDSKADINPFISTCLFSTGGLLFLIMVAAILVGFGIIYFNSTMDYKNMIFAGLALLISTIFLDYLLILLRAKREATRHSIYKAIIAISRIALPLIFIRLCGPGYLQIVYGIALSYLMIVFYEIFRTRYYQQLKISLFSGTILQRLFRYGMPLVGAGATTTILSLADRYMLAFYRNEGELGIYSAGYRLAEMSVDTIGEILLAAYVPIIIKSYNEHGKTGINEILQEPFKLILVVLVPITFGAIYLAKDLVTFFLGTGFRNAYTVFFWICLGTLCSCINHLYTRVFELKETTKMVFYITLSAAASNILLNIYFIPRFGYTGAAYSTFISYVIQLMLSQNLSKKITHIAIPWKTALNTTIASVFMCLLLYLFFKGFTVNIYLGLPLKIICGALIYLFILIMMRDVTIMRSLSGFFRKVKLNEKT